MSTVGTKILSVDKTFAELSILRTNDYLSLSNRLSDTRKKTNLVKRNKALIMVTKIENTNRHKTFHCIKFSSKDVTKRSRKKFNKTDFIFVTMLESKYSYVLSN